MNTYIHMYIHTNMHTYVQEMLRVVTPVTRAYREVGQSFCYKGVGFEKGQQVQLNLATANIDETAFPDAQRFRPQRAGDAMAKAHLAFGFRHHLCPGLKLGRLTSKAALTAVCAAFPGLQLAVQRRHVRTLPLDSINALESLPVRCTLATHKGLDTHTAADACPSATATREGSALEAPEAVRSDNDLAWEAVTDVELTAHKRKELRTALSAGRVLLLRCDEAANYYLASLPPPAHMLDAALSDVGTLEALVTARQRTCRNSPHDHALWEQSKQDLKMLMQGLFDQNVAQVLAVLPDSGVVAVLRTLDDLDTALDPPRFGDALVKFMPNTRRPKVHELMLGMKNSQDRLDALMGRGRSGVQQASVFENYFKRFNYDQDDGLPFRDMTCKLFDRAQVRSIETTREMLEAEKQQHELERQKRVESGNKYRQLAHDKRNGHTPELPLSVSLVDELKAAQGAAQARRTSSGHT